MRTKEVVAVSVPEVPVTVTVEVPAVAVLLAFRESTLVPVAGLVPNVAVTPLGSPDAASVTLPVNPSKSLTVMVVVPAAPPGLMDRPLVIAELVSVKPDAAGPARALIRFWPFGLPQPVTRL